MFPTTSQATAACAALFCCALLCGAAWAEPSVTVALLQMGADGNNIAANLDKAERFCRDAAAQGADIALMPEMWSIGYTRFDPDEPDAREKFYTLALATDSPEIQRFSALARELDMAIAVTYLQAHSPLPRNAVTLFDRHGKELFTYAKVHTCDFKPMEASMTPGDAFFTAELDTRAGTVRVGAMICFDREQPESARLLMLQGAELVLTPNACGLEEMRLDQFKIRAWENKMVVAMANYPKPEQNGCSCAFDSSGKRLAMAEDGEGMVLASFDLDELRRSRAKSIHGNAYRRPHRYQALVSTERDPVWQRTDGNGNPFEPEKR